MSTPGLRRLPTPVAPFPSETLASYLGRLARANHLTRQVLDWHLGRTGAVGNDVDPERLAAVIGRREAVLRLALPELGRHPSAQTEIRAACRRCAARRGIAGRVSCWVPGHPYVCIRHRIWIGPGVLAFEDQHDLGRLPEVASAARRHRRLVAHHGAAQTRRAYRSAYEVTLGWAEQGWWARHLDRRLCLIAPPHPLLVGRPALNAAIYPETVSLAAIMLSPTWVAAAASPHGRQRFYAEVARRLDLPDYRPGDDRDPLLAWVRAESPFALERMLPVTSKPENAHIR